eukprot:Protomagalhaensia_sp_Gyna_25__6059@NODE_964_length_2347_cov_380_591854_g766_i0_p1_GENE_NODE_964_length_2347_cov_380_591854_g766_i0NODE_964_length_2347_cov_380_591854_g766_i0_p1_ORF_typecomplete_len358_score77_50Ribosomal_L1/PF00687_21/1_6e04Ribosomal_L1/PF00687_21/2_9e30Ubiquitin_3/PF14836_6/2Ubiquitin_3/PF14836_6/1_2e02_NODE_964_length_2347_cov_380_591854_g766_i0691142
MVRRNNSQQAGPESQKAKPASVKKALKKKPTTTTKAKDEMKTVKKVHKTETVPPVTEEVKTVTKVAKTETKPVKQYKKKEGKALKQPAAGADVVAASTESSKTEKALAQATKLVLAYHKKQSETKGDLTDENKAPLYVQATISKTVQKPEKTPTEVILPHPPYTLDAVDVCLITKSPQRLWKNKLEEERERLPFIKRVIEFRKLVKKFPTPKDKRHLKQSYDAFLADASVIEVIPGRLGKVFREGGKMPMRMQRLVPDEPMYDRIISAMKKVRILLRPGLTVTLRVGDAGMPIDTVVENAQVVLAALQEKLLSLFGTDSETGLPASRVLYVSMTVGAEGSVAVPVEFDDLESQPKTN